MFLKRMSQEVLRYISFETFTDRQAVFSFVVFGFTWMMQVAKGLALVQIDRCQSVSPAPSGLFTVTFLLDNTLWRLPGSMGREKDAKTSKTAEEEKIVMPSPPTLHKANHRRKKVSVIAHGVKFARSGSWVWPAS